MHCVDAFAVLFLLYIHIHCSMFRIERAVS